MHLRDGDEVVGFWLAVSGVGVTIASGIRIAEHPTSPVSYIGMLWGLAMAVRGIFVYRRGRPLVLTSGVPRD